MKMTIDIKIVPLYSRYYNKYNSESTEKTDDFQTRNRESQDRFGRFKNFELFSRYTLTDIVYRIIIYINTRNITLREKRFNE